MSMAKIRLSELDTTLTAEELAEMEAAEHKDPVYDEDSPEMTAEMLMQFKRMSSEERNKQTVSLRLSPKTMKIAKSYGKGYTSFLSRLLDEAISNKEMVKRCM